MGAHTFYKAIARALILREGGTRKGSPFANNPVGIICKSGGTHTFVQSDSLCPDFTRRGNPQRFPLHTTPSLRWGGLAGGIFASPRSKLKNQQKTSIQLNFFEPMRYNDIKQPLRTGKSLQGVNIPMRSESVNAVQLRFNKASGDRNG